MHEGLQRIARAKLCPPFTLVADRGDEESEAPRCAGRFGTRSSLALRKHLLVMRRHSPVAATWCRVRDGVDSVFSHSGH